jgi:hypothetical protein
MQRPVNPRVEKLFADYGVEGVRALCARVSNGRATPRPGTVAVWKSRRRIPAEWMLDLILVVMEDGNAPP